MKTIRLARVHLDPVGGLAGDMFAAALADAFPECVPGLMDELRRLQEGRGEGIRFVPHSDSSLTGLRFLVENDSRPAPPHDHGDGDHARLHVPHRRIREQLVAAGLQSKVLEHALGLFRTLAEAEARVHGVAPDDVEFHEAGAWDSIVDFVAAAYFIAALAPDRWTLGALPLGSGRVRTAHGVLPIPAPATALLLRGLDVIDDGVGGERVTPTGAAIARYLSGRATDGDSAARPAPKVVAAAGHGFGTRTLPGVPNMLRVLAFSHSSSLPGPLDEEIAVLQFEIDDQTAEDLAVALDRIRAAPGTLDACQIAVYGKKGRLATQVQVLARLDAADRIADLCLAETTTLGVRIARVWRRTALRAQVETSIPERVRVKVAERPSGELTAKAEMDDLAHIPGDRTQREDARRRAESQALETAKSYEPRDRHDD